MIESFITAFAVLFVVVDPIGNVPLFLAVTNHQSSGQKRKTAVEGTLVAIFILMLFAVLGPSLLGYLGISLSAFKIAGGIILFLLALSMLSSERQVRKKESADAAGPDNLGIYPIAVPLLAGPSAIATVMVIAGDLTESWTTAALGLGAIGAVGMVTLIVLVGSTFIEAIISARFMEILSRIMAIILAALSVQYVIDGLSELGLLSLAS